MLSKTFAAIGLLSLTASPVMAANFMQINLPPAPNAQPFNTDATGVSAEVP